MKFIFATLAALALSACAGAVPWNDQSCAGITTVDVKWSEQGAIERVQVCQGKEGESFDVDVDMTKKTASWHGKGVRAFDGQRVRAAVEEAVSEDVKSAAPGIVETIVKAVTGLR